MATNDGPATAPIRRGFVDTSIGQVHYRMREGGDIPFAFFHETPLSSEIFLPSMRRLPPIFRVLALDTPGYGDSASPTRPLSIEEYAAIQVEAMDALGFAPSVLAGTHTGASIALEVWNLRRHGVQNLVLTGVPIFSPSEREWRKENHAPELASRLDGSHLSWAWSRYRRKMGDETPIELLNLTALHLVQSAAHYGWAYQAAFDYDPIPRLRELDLPTLIVNGSGDILADADREASEYVNGSVLNIVEGVVGHIYWRDPDTYCNAVMGLLGNGGDEVRNVR